MQPSLRLALPRTLRSRLALIGPAFVAAIAYVDPGNFATNFTSGSLFGYRLLWVIVAANLVGMVFQHLTATVGIATGRSLAEVCRDRFTKRVNIGLWLQADVAAIATELAEFCGAVIGLNLLCGLDPLGGAAIAAVLGLALTIFQTHHARPFEAIVILMLAALGMAIVFVTVRAGHQDTASLVHGLVPTVPGHDAVIYAIGIVGATVMPHAVYLHSALRSRRPRDLAEQDRRALSRTSAWECVFALGVAGVVNACMLCIAAGPLRRGDQHRG